MGPSSSSGGDTGSDLGGGARGGETEGDDALDLLGHDDDPYHPGPSHAPPPPHLAPTSPHHQGPSHFQMNGSQGDETDEDGLAETTVRILCHIAAVSDLSVIAFFTCAV